MKDKDKLISGIIVGAGGLLAGKVIKDAISKSYIDTFLRSCSDFEKYAKKNLKERKIIIAFNSTFNDLLLKLNTYKILNQNEIGILYQIRDMRNKVVHGNHDALSKYTSDKYCRSLKMINTKLKTNL